MTYVYVLRNNCNRILGAYSSKKKIEKRCAILGLTQYGEWLSGEAIYEKPLDGTQILYFATKIAIA